MLEIITPVISIFFAYREIYWRRKLHKHLLQSQLVEKVTKRKYAMEQLASLCFCGNGGDDKYSNNIHSKMHQTEVEVSTLVATLPVRNQKFKQALIDLGKVLVKPSNIRYVFCKNAPDDAWDNLQAFQNQINKIGPLLRDAQKSL